MQKILIVDDEKPVRKLISRVLSSSPWEILTASDGEEGLAAACARNPDLILLDVDMPKKNGWEVLKALRENLRTRMTPVIMLTGYGRVSDKIWGFEHDADDYVTKPFAVEEVRARVENLLRRSQRGFAANPLSGLPGSFALEREVVRRIGDKEPFAFFYIDIDRLKDYNDACGYARGNRVLRETAEVLDESLRQTGGPGNFLAHMGGDDFAALTGPARAPDAAQRIVTRFDEAAPSFYGPADRRRGWLETKDRDGNPRRLPLLTLSVGITTTELRVLDDYDQLIRIAAEMKAAFQSGPKKSLSRFAFDRRADSSSRPRT